LLFFSSFFFFFFNGWCGQSSQKCLSFFLPFFSYFLTLLVSIFKEHAITLLSSHELVDYQVVLYFLTLKNLMKVLVLVLWIKTGTNISYSPKQAPTQHWNRQ
jgi:hypothetical protein